MVSTVHVLGIKVVLQHLSFHTFNVTGENFKVIVKYFEPFGA